ncbi:MAG: SapC family protein [Candidatus Omnitrophica bacterium]|nr:SapC family protein [Candidatus Omnitrophota bacterium]
MKEVDIVPLTFSELINCAMYYPIIFVNVKNEVFPFAVLGVNGKNIYLSEEGFFKVDIIPKVVLNYPFGVIKKKRENEEEWLIVVDEICKNGNGEKLFEKSGEETSYFKAIKLELTDLALDFQRVYEFSQEIYKLGYLKSINFNTVTKYGEVSFKNIFIGNIEVLSKIPPEKLYYLNTKGYLPIFYSIYLSVRNFKLFNLI